MSMHVSNVCIAAGTSNVAIDVGVGGWYRGMVTPASAGGEGGGDAYGEGARGGNQPPGRGLHARSAKEGNADGAGTSRSRGTRGGRSGNEISSSESE